MMHHSSLANPLHIYHMDALSKPPPYQPHALKPNDRGLICGTDAMFEKAQPECPRCERRDLKRAIDRRPSDGWQNKSLTTSTQHPQHHLIFNQPNRAPQDATSYRHTSCRFYYPPKNSRRSNWQTAFQYAYITAMNT